jgi:predicted dehydrogenase
MAVSTAEAARMIAASTTGGAALMVAHCWRFHPEVAALRRRVAGVELGDVVKTRGYGIHTGWGPSGWFTEPELAGGGALMDMGVHAIDTARYLLGDPAPVRVCAAIGTRYGAHVVDDDGILLITWSNGTNSIVESGWWQPHAGGLEADTELYGTRGYARVWGYTEPPGPEYEHCTQPMYSAQMDEFVSAVRAGRAPQPDGEAGAVVIRVVEEAYRSAAATAG